MEIITCFICQETDGCAKWPQAHLSPGCHMTNVAGEWLETIQAKASVASGSCKALTSADKSDVDEIVDNDSILISFIRSLPSYENLLI